MFSRKLLRRYSLVCLVWFVAQAELGFTMSRSRSPSRVEDEDCVVDPSLGHGVCETVRHGKRFCKGKCQVNWCFQS